MRDTRIFTTAFAAALASLLGLGPGAAADLSSSPQSYESERASGESLPIWLVRYKLRQRGYQDIYRVSMEVGGFAVLAHDRWGRHVRLFVDPHSGNVIPRPGYGLAQLRPGDVNRHLASLGFKPLSEPSYRDDHYEALAEDAQGTWQIVKIDPVSGAAWSGRA